MLCVRIFDPIYDIYFDIAGVEMISLMVRPLAGGLNLIPVTRLSTDRDRENRGTHKKSAPFAPPCVEGMTGPIPEYGFFVSGTPRH